MASFNNYLRGLLDRAGAEARRARSTTVEAQHLLLAMATDPGRTGVLIEAGLDHAAIDAALTREFTHSLHAVGVVASAFDVPPATPDPQQRPQLGTSVRLTLDRAMKAAAGSEPTPTHLLLGILQAEVGTVPRALALAGIDRADLIARVQRTLRQPATS